MPAPPTAADQQLVAQFLVELQKIGIPSGDWLTVPDLVQEGVPGEALDDTQPLQLLFDHYQTVNRDQEAGDINAHAWTSRFRVWIAAKIVAGDASFGRSKLRAAAADVWRAIEAAEATFDTLSAAEGLDFGTYQVHRDLDTAGWAVASIDIDVKRSQLHGAT